MRCYNIAYCLLCASTPVVATPAGGLIASTSLPLPHVVCMVVYGICMMHGDRKIATTYILASQQHIGGVRTRTY